MVVDGTSVKVLAWYDNEIGYVNRMIELAREGRSLAMNATARSVAATAPTISIRNYAIVTAAYWAFTLTDGALRMLVLLHFNELGLHARPARVSVPALRILRHRHESRRWLGRVADWAPIDARSRDSCSRSWRSGCSRC